MPKQRFARVNFQLPVLLAARFDQHALEQGMPKAQLLRKWLAGAKHGLAEIGQAGGEGFASFNFRIPQEDFANITKLSRKFGFTRSAYIRLLITHRLQFDAKFDLPNSAGVAGELAQPAFEPARFNRANLHNAEGLDELQLVQLARHLVDSAELDLALQILDLLDSKLSTKPRNHLLFAESYTVRGTVARHKRDLQLSKHYLTLAQRTVESNPELYNWPHALIQLGVVADLQDDLPTAIALADRGLEILNAGQRKAPYVRSYMRLSNLFALVGDVYQVERYNSLAQSVLDRPGKTSPNLVAYFQIRRSVSDIRLSLFDQAAARLQQVETSGVALNPTEQKFLLEDKAMLAFLHDDHRTAQKLWRQAESVEERLGINRTNFSKLKLWQLAAMAKLDYTPAVKQMQGLVEFQPRPIYPQLGKYLLYSTQYVHSPTSLDRQIAGNKLADLTKKGNHMIKSAATFTLQHKRLVAVV